MAKVTLDKIVKVESVSSRYHDRDHDASVVSILQVSQLKLIKRKRIRVPSQIRFPGAIYPDSIGNEISYSCTRHEIDRELLGYRYYEDIHVLDDLTIGRKYVAKNYLRFR